MVRLLFFGAWWVGIAALVRMAGRTGRKKKAKVVTGVGEVVDETDGAAIAAVYLWTAFKNKRPNRGIRRSGVVVEEKRATECVLKAADDKFLCSVLPSISMGGRSTNGQEATRNAVPSEWHNPAPVEGQKGSQINKRQWRQCGAYGVT